ncbi:MAG: hypothetical protein M5U26_22110 [Planctomycetota bacterium]|nr:hypothetical protein [Planctomycetota bacterium]
MDFRFPIPIQTYRSVFRNEGPNGAKAHGLDVFSLYVAHEGGSMHAGDYAYGRFRSSIVSEYKIRRSALWAEGGCGLEFWKAEHKVQEHGIHRPDQSLPAP